mgnify:CR=1 FL=1
MRLHSKRLFVFLAWLLLSCACLADTPMNGWWWNPTESGRGFAIERQGDKIFLAGFLYESSGSATWYVSILDAKSNGNWTGDMTRYTGGQTLLGPYQAPTSTSVVATAVVNFDTPNTGQMALTFKDGHLPKTLQLERFPFWAPIPFAPSNGSYESGWWWNESESGRGYFIETQGSQAFIASFMYDSTGQPTWYAMLANVLTPSIVTGGIQQYINGQSLSGDYKAPTLSPLSAGDLTIRFSDNETGVLILPNGHSVPIKRFLFSPSLAAINVAPVAVSRVSGTATTGKLVTLDGSQSSDANHDQLTYKWSLVSKPPSSSATILKNDESSASFIPDLIGDYVFKLIVNDGRASSPASFVTAHVFAPPLTQRPQVFWRETSNTLNIDYKVISNYWSRNGFGTFNFFDKGYKSFFFPTGGEFNTPRSQNDNDFIIFSVDNNNQIRQELSPFKTKYIAGFVTSSLIGDFGAPQESIIFIDQGRENTSTNITAFEKSYLWRVDKVNNNWQATEFAQELGRNFWHSSNNAIDINGDGVLDFVASNLLSDNQQDKQVLFLSNKITSKPDSFDLTANICKSSSDIIFNSGSSALIRLSNGRTGVISMPYTANPPYSAGDKGSIMTLSLDGRKVDKVQCIDVRNTPLTAVMTNDEGYNAIHVLDVNGDGLDDFIALAESGNGSKFRKLIIFTQLPNGEFINANKTVNIPFNYSLPNASSKSFTDWVSNELFITDINSDGLPDIFMHSQLIDRTSLDQYGIRGGLVNVNGVYQDYTIPKSDIFWNAEDPPFQYRYIIPIELNNDGIVDFLMIGNSGNQKYITPENPYGLYYRVSFLLSEFKK